MPRFDKTGPEGKGSQTGRRMGTCNPEGRGRNRQEDADNSLGTPKRDGSGQGSGQGSGGGQGAGDGRGKGNRKGGLGRFFGMGKGKGNA